MNLQDFRDKKGIILSKDLLYIIEPQKDKSTKEDLTTYLFKGYIGNKPRAHFTPFSFDSGRGEYILTQEETASRVQSLEGKINPK